MPCRITKLLFILITLLVGISAHSQQKFTISGEVKDSETGEYLVGASIVAMDIQKGIVSNPYGFYSLTLPGGEHLLEISLIGYESQKQEFLLSGDLVINFDLVPKSTETATVIIESDKNNNTQSTEIGKIELDVDQIKKLPVLLGEIDILKTITLLPGVRSSGEGNAGLYVRGGGVDQNLILLDNATVYNASHLFGFFSVFNADAVKNLELTKGGVPSNYGTRLSSVIDIALKEGNAKELSVAGGVGTISSRITVEGPIKKDVSSFIVSARRTYIDVLLKPFIKPESNFGGSGYYFYDLNAKLNYRISKKDQLFLSGYFGRDVFSFKSKLTNFSSTIPWGNATATMRWNRIIGQKMFMNAIATFTDYQFAFEGKQDEFEFKLKSGIRDYGAKVQWNYYPNYLHNIKWGLEYTHHLFTPNNATARSGDTEFDLGKIVKIYSHEMAVYVLDDFDINERLKINAGLRYSHFIHVGPFDRYVYPESSTPGVAGDLPEVISYKKGDKIKAYGGLEPRLNFRFTLNKKSSIKGGYMRNYQYIHLTSLSPTSLPTDVWLPSTDKLSPQIGNQVSLGYFRNFLENKWESSVEVYYKTMQNQSEFREGAQPDQTVNDNIDNLLIFGRGYSYGAEFFLKKRTGKLNGWIGYTWSKTYRVFADIDNGDPYPTRWDRRHDLSFVLSYTITKRFDCGFVFVYGTGNAITLPIERYIFENRVVSVYGERNSFRMAPYHRADISATYRSKTTKKIVNQDTNESTEVPKKFRSNWTFSVYNLYNRRNPYFIYFGNEGNLNEGTLKLKAYQVSLFPILPSITWNFEF